MHSGNITSPSQVIFPRTLWDRHYNICYPGDSWQKTVKKVVVWAITILTCGLFSLIFGNRYRNSPKAATEADLVLHKYATSGVIIRMLGGNGDGAKQGAGPTLNQCLPYEFGCIIDRPAVSSTYIKQDLPIFPAPCGSVGLIYNPDKLHINNAFKIDAYSKQGNKRTVIRAGIKDRSTPKQRTFEGLIDYAQHPKHPHFTIAGISAKISRMIIKWRSQHNNHPLHHNELLIRRPSSQDPMSDAIIGIIVRGESLASEAALKTIQECVEAQKQNLPLFTYDAYKGVLTPLN